MKKLMKRIGSLLLSATMTLTLLAPAIPAASAAGDGTTYYVSTVDGSDSYDGLSEAQPFYSLNKINSLTLGAGDKVYLECGSVFENQYLHIKGSGSAESPIVIDAYGTGDKPLINTNGNGIWYQNYGAPLDNSNHVWRDYVSSSILLFDVEYIEVSNIAMTNGGDPEEVVDGPTVPGETGYNANGTAGSYTSGKKMNRTGVAVVTQDIGTADHIYLKDLDIQNVYGNIYDKHMNNGGIYFTVAKPHDEATTGISRFNDVLIDGCYLKHTSRWGIALAYTAYWSKFSGAAISDATAQKYGATNVIIRNNYLEDVGGDPLTTMYAFKPLIEYNVSYHGSREISNYYHNDGSKGNKGTVAAGIWPWKCKSALFQFNECYEMLNGTTGNGDAQAWDADWGDSTIYQYNYSSGNTGGCVMFCLDEAYNTVFRYNISYQDGSPTRGVLNTCSAPNGKYYNNTYIIGENVPIIRSGMAGGPPIHENNIFCYMGATPRTENWYLETPNAKYDTNLYVNYTNTPAGDSNAVTAASATDVFAVTPEGPTVPLTTKGTNGWAHDWTTTFESFKLSEESPAINAGKEINLLNGLAEDHGVDPITKDFYGTTLDASHDIGAHDTNKVDLKLSSTVYTVDQTNKTIAKVTGNVTVKDFLSNITTDKGVTVQVQKNGVALAETATLDMECTVVLSCDDKTAAYSFVKDMDKELKSCVFELGRDKTTGELTYTVNVPFGNGFPISASEFLAGIEVAATATAAVYDGAAVTTSNLADGMTLRITAQDGTTQDYTIAQKNEYNHVNDWINQAVQGNVWYAQIKSDGAYRNMEKWDSTYFCWGEGAPSYASVESYSICQDINANSSDASTSMAFRAPVSGTVQVSFGAFGDSVGENEIKFRKMSDNKNTGTVTMVVTVNGTALSNKSFVLSKEAAVPVNAFTVTVEQGDMLRFEAQNLGNTPDAGFAMVPVITYTQLEEDDTQAPTVPGNVTVTPADDGGVVVWDASTDDQVVTGYKVYLNDGEQPVGTTDGDICTYTLTDLTPWTDYTVKVSAVDAAGNESAKTEMAFKTTDSETPTAPEELTATGVTTSSADLSWTESTDNVDVAQYVVTYTPATGTPLTREVTTNACQLTGLTKNTVYNVSVVAKDAAGNTSDAATTSFTTLESEDTTPPAMPTDVAVSDVTGKGAKITWSAVADESDLKGYTVYYTNNGTTISNTVGAYDTTYTLTGLTDCTTYSVVVDAYDTSGNHSEKSTGITFTTLDVTAPSVPTNVVVTASDSTNIIAVWNASTDNSGKVKEYVVTLKQGSTTVGTPLTVTMPTVSFTDLTEKTSYTVNVVAKDAAGNTSPVATGTITTPAALDTTPPTQPAALAATNITSTSASITWKAATDNQGVVKYTVAYSTIQGLSGTKDVQTTVCTLDKLTADTSYTVTVTAYDAAGNKTTSDPVTFTTKAQPTAPDTEAPGVPGNLTIGNVTSTDATINWTAPHDNVGVVKYRIYNNTTFVADTLDVTYTITRLSAGTSYTAKVTALDAAGNESAPAHVSFITASQSGGSSGGGSSSSGSTGGTTTTNPDGSTVVTTTDKATGTVTETTTTKDGVKAVTETKKDGTKSVIVTLPSTVTANVSLPVAAVKSGESITIKAEKKVIVTIPSVDTRPGVVAVIVKADGTEEIVRKSVTGENGISLTLDGTSVIKLMDNSKSFSDVPTTNWAAGAVAFASSRELFNGTGADTFSPDTSMTRAMLMTVLARFDGQDTTTGDQWYSVGMDWAKKMDISDGTNPDGSITREQLAVMLYRYGQQSGIKMSEGTTVTKFDDADKISDWANDAMSWAIGSGIITGKSNTSLDPNGTATRAEVATMLMRFTASLNK